MKIKTFTLEQTKILSEIYRRLNYFDKDLNDPLLLVAYPSEVKSINSLDLVKPYSKEIKRVYCWYGLTDKGKKFFSNYLLKGKLSDNSNLNLFNGGVKRFDFSLLD